MADSDRKSHGWAHNVALVVALLGIAGSIAVAVLTEQMRRDAQTLLLRRDAYAQYLDAVRNADDSLRGYAFAIGTQVDVTVAYQRDASQQPAWAAARDELRIADDEVDTAWDEVLRTSDRLLLVASGDVLAQRRSLLSATHDRIEALERLRGALSAPDVTEWTPDEALVAFAVVKVEDQPLLDQFDASFGRFLSAVQLDVNSDSTA